MFRLAPVLIVVVGMAIWPFANSGKAQDGEGAGSSARALSDRIDSLERKIKRLENKISRLESRKGNAEAGADGAPPTDGGRAQGKGPCPGEWRKIGGGWVCYDPNAK